MSEHGVANKIITEAQKVSLAKVHTRIVIYKEFVPE
jgi:hypothetical protein